jgi:hypothetical protein
MLHSLLLPIGFDKVGDLILTYRALNLLLHGKFALTLGGATATLCSTTVIRPN